MGASVCSPCNEEIRTYKPVIDTQTLNKDWSDAVINGKIAGIKGLHQEDPDLINEMVDEHGHTAIHVAVKDQRMDILTYLLDNGVDINMRGGPFFNTALHEAVLSENRSIIGALYKHGINDELLNIRKHKAIDLCTDKFKRHFLKAKQSGIQQQRDNSSTTAKPVNRMPSVRVVGIDVNDMSKSKTLRRYLEETDDANAVYMAKRQEIALRNKKHEMLTAFGEECGVEVDEIAMRIKDEDLEKVWNKMVPSKAKEVTKRTDVYKILYACTMIAIKQKYNASRRPPATAIQKLTTRLVAILPNNKAMRRQTSLTQEVFCKHITELLLKVHQQMVDEIK